MRPDANRALVEAQLERVALSAAFARAARLREFLRFVVVQSFEATDGSFKEISIGVELFKRRPGYDTSKDAVVRTTASRVRQRLHDYYDTEGANDEILIELPPDGYAPRITCRNSNGASAGGFVSELEPRQTVSAQDVAVPDGFSAAATLGTPDLTKKRVLLVAGLLSLIAAGLLFLSATLQQVKVIEFTQLTHDGHGKQGPLLVDGSRLYFREFADEGTGPMPGVSIPTAGGDPTPLRIRGRAAVVASADALEHHLLVYGVDGKWDGRGWIWRPGQPVSNLPEIICNMDVAWISRGTYACAEGAGSDKPNTLDIVVAGSAARRLLTLQRAIGSLCWLPRRQLLRFTVRNLRQSDESEIWESAGLKGRPHPLAGLPPGARQGRWSADGSIYTFVAQGDGKYDVWGIDERFSGKLRKPFRLTNGPLDFQYPVPSDDGRIVYAIGRERRGELMRYDWRARAFFPYLHGMNATEVDYSRDGQWMTYVDFPGYAIWKARADGSGRVRLTQTPMSANQPHWSPDGKTIAFMGQLPGRETRIYLVSPDGGKPVEATDYPGYQGVPTWSSDGSKIVFGDLLYQKAHAEMGLTVLDVKQRQVTPLPGSKGTWTPRWSPDGRYIAGLTPDSRRLLLYEWSTNQWRDLASFPHIDDPVWSANSTAIYFWATTPKRFYRYDVKRSRCEMLIDLAPYENNSHYWYGVTPDGTPLAMRGLEMAEVYALKLGK